MASRAKAPQWRDTMKAGARRSGALIGGVALFLGVLLLSLALISYHAQDPSLNTAAAGPARNMIGAPGAWVSDILFSLLGAPVWLLMPVGLIAANRLWQDRPLTGFGTMLRWGTLGAVLFGASLAFVPVDSTLPAGRAGLAGLLLAKGLRWALEYIGEPTASLWIGRGIALVLGFAGLWIWARALDFSLPERNWSIPQIPFKPKAEREREFDEPFRPAPAADGPKPQPRKVAMPDARPGPVIADRQISPSPARSKPPSQTSLDFKDSYKLPPLDLLKAAPPNSNAAIDKAALERNARLLESVLDDFHVKGQIVEVRPGPVVTMYELEPASGIKASRVIQLADDIARNMSAISARVATIPGRSVIGIELPNAKREGVNLHELIGSETFEDQGATLPLVLGKNIAGEPIIADLAPMPHLLVAGTTGSGKSVGLNCMILSLLYRLTPDQCRMIMIDPKMLELSMYKGIPHLLAEVVTEPPKAVRALKWAVEQMEDRYRMMASVNVRSLASFNDKVRQAKAKGQKLGRKVQSGYDEQGRPIYEEETLDLHVLPQIVIVVDELADLMMTAGKEVEFLIQRLAQKARAAGIHLIMATQRPSVDVITGVIKANLPTRISFHVTSKIDSRTILGEQGAEQLLGKGDMLYMPGGKQLTRVHGPFVSDDEVQAVADHWRSQGEPDYITAVTEEPEDGGFALEGSPEGDDSPEEQTYRRAVQLVAESQKASTSWLQRQLRVGYNTAARLIERMEKDGLVSRPDHVGRREVLMDTDGRPL
ncbi:DNA translocase FtsK 4TM domain-containing protein [Sphingomonas sp. AOB5]|uniref:FtsK/SpoIIIE family DNA translocase n=1 Tax=Sphingomonas sp. AOB5 TaxID=3034017 RepID=UPI0023F85A61|nr:DNA translocase FtsK 4TM domain-containing protein [Sphingomonas sp. AOB5]MDF7774156.1 DNA translocase FtsK 4TM domain-containing protein [Sphingomonas sp. AOB5]